MTPKIHWLPQDERPEKRKPKNRQLSQVKRKIDDAGRREAVQNGRWIRVFLATCVTVHSHTVSD
jgi:hypothetical protein